MRVKSDVSTLRLRLVLFCVTFAACSPGPPEHLDIATTTTVSNSGLLAELLPGVKGPAIRVHASDSVHAIAMLYDEVVDLVITHDGNAEARALGEQPTWMYRRFAYNYFVLVGPPDDPAQVRTAADLGDAFRRIATTPVTYVARSEDSDIRTLERRLWREATFGLPSPTGRMITRTGIATLDEAAGRHGYALTDTAVFWRNENRLDLTVLFERDPRLLNSYAVIYSRLNGKAVRLAEWLTGADAGRRISDYRVQGRTVFTVWPSGCPDDNARDDPCRLNAAGKPIKDEMLFVDGMGPPRTVREMKAAADAVVVARYTGISHEFPDRPARSQGAALPKFERLGEFEVLEVVKPHSVMPSSGRIETDVPGSYQEFPRYILHTYADGVDEPLPGRTYVVFLRYLGSRSEGTWRSAWPGYSFYDVSGDYPKGLARGFEFRERTTKGFLDDLRAH